MIVALSPAVSFAAGESIGGKLIQTTGEERVPIAGGIVIVSQDGAEIGSDESDADGIWEIPVPGAGVYDARLDTSTLHRPLLTDARARDRDEHESHHAPDHKQCRQ